MTKFHESPLVSGETVSLRVFWVTLIALFAVGAAFLSAAAFAQQRDPRCDFRDECTFSPRPYPGAAPTIIMPEHSARAHDPRCDVRDECSAATGSYGSVADKADSKTRMSGKPNPRTN